MSATSVARDAARHAMLKSADSTAQEPLDNDSPSETFIKNLEKTMGATSLQVPPSQLEESEVLYLIKAFFSNSRIRVPGGMERSAAHKEFLQQLGSQEIIALGQRELHGVLGAIEDLIRAWEKAWPRQRVLKGDELVEPLDSDQSSAGGTILDELLAKDPWYPVDPLPGEFNGVHLAKDFETQPERLNVSHVPCKFFRMGACQAGDVCPFSHDLQETSTTVCKYFLKGNCKFGPKCANDHILPDGRLVNHRRLPADPFWEETGPADEQHNSQNVKETRRFDWKTNKRMYGSKKDRFGQDFGSETAVGSESGSQFSQSYRPPDSFTSFYSAQSSLRTVNSPVTNFTPGSYYSGLPRRTPLSFQQSPAYYSAKSSFALASGRSKESPVNPLSDYLKAVWEKGLVLPVDQELNWSGKAKGGQHVEFLKGEELPFEVIGPIGASLTAQVDKVRCRRIPLARKTMVCGRRMSVEEALVEVEHLQHLRHPHIVQLVGSYLQGKKFSVLLYPVADCDLSTFLDEVLDTVRDIPNMKDLQASQKSSLCAPAAVASMWSFFGCLADAIRYIHSTARKHLDIKPGNILVKKHPEGSYGYRVYIADFGISRSFRSSVGDNIYQYINP